MLPENIGQKYDMPQTFRIKFTKGGRLKFISHLDLCRTMKAVILRAGIPIWYTEGFNPHPKMVFAASLSLGQCSECEFLDIKLTHKLTSENLMQALNDAMPEGLHVKAVYIPSSKFTSVAWSKYTVTCRSYDLSPLSRDTIVTMKRTKSGEKETDIKPQIHAFAPIDDTHFELVLRADNINFLNPDLVLKVLGIEDYEILRTALMLEDGVTPFI